MNSVTSIDPRNTSNTGVTRKLYHLEAARGVASVIVFFHHFIFAFVPHLEKPAWSGGIKYTPMYFFVNGQLAVMFFFILSGFVLTSGFYKRSAPDRLLSSIIKRLPRLWLPVALSIFIGCLILSIGGADLALHASAISGSDWLAKFGNVSFPARFEPTFRDALRQSVMVFLHPGDIYYNSNLWTMMPEFRGSMMVFAMVFIVYALSAKRVKSLAQWLHPVVILGLLIIHHPDYAAFMTGSALSHRIAIKEKLFNASRTQIAFMVFLFFIGASFPAGSFGISTLLTGALAITILLSSTFLAGKLSGKVGEWLGYFSFPLYLVHTIVILGPGSWFYLVLSGHVGGGEALALTFAASSVLSTMLALPIIYIDRYWTRSINRIFSRFPRVAHV